MMNRTFTPAETCAIVAHATNHPLDPKMLRQWRHRGVLRRRDEQEGGWTRYSFKEVFELCAIGDALATSGHPIGAAAGIASVARDYAPGSGGRVESGDADAKGGYMLVLGSISCTDDSDEGSVDRAALMHVTETHKLFSPASAVRFGGNTLTVVMITELRKRFLAAVASLDAA